MVCVGLYFLKMITLMSDLYSRYCGSPEYNIAILGLEKTGKTQLLKALKDLNSPYMVGLNQQYKPTIGLNTTQISMPNKKYLIWDLGGKQSFRKVWENYYPYCHGVIYLFDERVTQGLECLKTILQHGQMSHIPVTIFVRNMQTYTQVKDQIEIRRDNDQMKDRQIMVELLPPSRDRLLEHLQKLYRSIRQLDKLIRN